VETLFESELFGHVRGAFTGAANDKPGLFEHAHGGTLFLDEIGDMPLATQAKLLRVLQNQEVLRVGSLTPRKVDVRVIAATNRDLRALVAEKQFREDLYYRLSMVEIRVPRLAERKEDLPLLERHFISKFATQYGKEVRRISPRTQVALSAYPWPGNVRELENAIGYAAMMATGDTIDVGDLPAQFQSGGNTTPPAAGVEAQPEAGTLEEQERRLIAHALEAAGGNQSRAARALKIGRDALRYKIKKHNL
jgi:transcriptional regulator with PAS, ATPase and Fis domain